MSFPNLGLMMRISNHPNLFKGWKIDGIMGMVVQLIVDLVLGFVIANLMKKN